MLFAEKTVRPQIGTLTSDRCARSGLHEEQPPPGTASSDGRGGLSYFATIYTSNLPEMSDFYKDVIGAEHLKIDSDSLLVFEHRGGSVVLKQVEAGSQFAKLIGRQSIGLVGHAPKTRGFRNETLGETLEWDTDVVQLNDPDGNILLFAAPEEAAQELLETGT